MMEEVAAKFSQGIQQLQAQNYQGAVEAFTATIAAFPQFEPAFRLRSEAYRNLGRDQAANADLESVVSITRARLQEAEQRLKSSTQTAGSTTRTLRTIADSGSSLFASPIILGTAIASGLLIVIALAMILLSGD